MNRWHLILKFNLRINWICAFFMFAHSHFCTLHFMYNVAYIHIFSFEFGSVLFVELTPIQRTTLPVETPMQWAQAYIFFSPRESPHNPLLSLSIECNNLCGFRISQMNIIPFFFYHQTHPSIARFYMIFLCFEWHKILLISNKF